MLKRLSWMMPAMTCLLMTVSAARAEKFQCLVEPYVEVNLASGVPGILAEVFVDRGDVVKKDQLLARLKSDVEQAGYDLAQAREQFANRRVQRNEELYRKQMISIHEKDEMETEAQILKLELREAKELMERRNIRSPLNGVVVKRNLSTGEYVQDLPIFELAQIDPLRVEVVVPVRLYGKIRTGMTGKVEWEAPLRGVETATVTVVDPVVDAASGTIGIRLELPNPDHRLPAGTQCTVTFSLE